jgi:hypothetical protein
MVDKNGNEGIKKVFLQVVNEARAILKVICIWNQRVGATRACVVSIEALTLWCYGSIA